MAEPPADIAALAEARQQARAGRDFATADRLRDEISELGWVVKDVPDGFTIEPKPPYDVLDRLDALPDRSAQPDTRRATVSVLVDGWPDDVRTCVEALVEHTPADVVVQALDLGNVGGAGDVLHSLAGPRVEEWHVSGAAAWSPAGAGPHGWAAARLALLRADTARIHVWCDLSTVLTGDAVTPLLDAIDADDRVVAAGWRGVDVDRADEWRSFTPAGPGDVDALLGYLLAVRRSAALAVGGPHPKARFYRNADMEFSFALREADPSARLVVPAADLSCRQDRHRGYHDTDPAYRDRESARTYQRLLQRFRGRDDLLAPH